MRFILDTCFYSIAPSKYESFSFFNKKNVLYFMHSKNYLDFGYSVIKFLHSMFFNDYAINGLETSLSTKL